MGEVYRARDGRLDREVAIKVLPSGFTDDSEPLRRFGLEAKALGALSHPNVLAIFDVGTHEGRPFLVTELLEGETLRGRLSHGPLPASTAIEIATQIARGLAAAHEKGLVHRDLKPENIFLTPEGVKILDFGLAKQASAFLLGAPGEGSTQDLQDLTAEGSFLGTVGYGSPEQARGETVDARSDLFALGGLIYEMLTGRRAFQGGSPADTLSAILKEDPPDLEVLARKASPGLPSVLKRCLEKRREDRFSSAQDLAFALQALVPSSPSGPKAESEEKSIVVLPFENLSPDPDNAFFADGLTEELIADLSNVKAIRVISRTSAMHFKGTTQQLPEIAQALKVRFALEGSVRRAGNTLRITAQLIEAATDAHLWAEKYTGTFDDVFDMQENVSRAIVEALKVQLTPAEDRKLAARPLPDPTAYECYLRANQDIWLFDPAALKRAEQHLEKARAIVGEHPLILAGLALVHLQAVNLGLGQDESLQAAKGLAERALALDSSLAQAHGALGFITGVGGDFPKGIGYLRKARAEAPGDTSAWGWLPLFYLLVGRTRIAATLAEEVLRLDPVDPNWHLQRATVPLYEGDFEESSRQYLEAQKILPDIPIHRFWRGLPLAFAGRRDSALEALESLPADPEVDAWNRCGHLLRAVLTGDAGKFDALLTEDALASFQRDGQYSYFMASFTAKLGRLEESLDWLENAVDRTHVPVRLYLSDPFLAPIRPLPRFQRILARAQRVQDSVPEEP
jgi:serine/threonine protein kinase/tetratricopeptide (TPR) repeat protein